MNRRQLFSRLLGLGALVPALPKLLGGLKTKAVYPETGISMRLIRQWNEESNQYTSRIDTLYGMGQVHKIGDTIEVRRPIRLVCKDGEALAFHRDSFRMFTYSDPTQVKVVG